jgi:hypothetical protein
MSRILRDKGLVAEVKQLAKDIVNQLLRPLAVRLVGALWGPRGFANSFLRARSQGIVPATVIDAGASDGRWTQECMQVFPSCRYALFEPLAENAPALQALAARHANVVLWTGDRLAPLPAA